VPPSPLVRYRPNELIVASHREAELLAAVGAEVANRSVSTTLGLTRLTFKDVGAPPGQIGQLSADNLALAGFATPNYVLTPWVSSGAGGWPQPTAVPVAQANWGGAVNVAVFDSGLLTGWDNHHPYLANAAPVSTADVIPASGANGTIGLFDCHGMFVAGVLLCAAPTAHVKVRRAFGLDGGTDDWTLATQIDNYLTQNPQIRLVNLSCGTFADAGHPPAALLQVIATHPQVLFVAAAGNIEATDPTVRVFPAAFDTVVGVGATDTAGNRTAFSDGRSVDVWAFGDHVDNAFGSGTVISPSSSAPFTGTAVWSGTSFAAPLAAAILTEFLAGRSVTAAGGSTLLATEAINWLRARYLAADGRIVLPHP
jgi:hypothetical protein